jgi:hypothetical protein
MNRSSTPRVRYHVLLYVIVLGALLPAVIGCGGGGELEAEPNDSLDLSICDWHGGRATAKLMVDSAPRAQPPIRELRRQA